MLTTRPPKPLDARLHIPQIHHIFEVITLLALFEIPVTSYEICRTTSDRTASFPTKRHQCHEICTVKVRTSHIWSNLTLDQITRLRGSVGDQAKPWNRVIVRAFSIKQSFLKFGRNIWANNLNACLLKENIFTLHRMQRRLRWSSG
jgi:hypothetical protein